jgi:hypothetical protein
MIRLLYISTSRQPVTPPMLADILRVSRRNNHPCGVTGLLVVGGKRFLQALEGPEDAVQATFDRIHKDPRHYALVQLARETVAKRSFPSWAMGAQAGQTPGESVTIDQAVNALIAPITDPTLRGYFTGFAERQAAA